MGKAKIFDIAGEENRIQRFVAFQMQCLLNSHAANANIGVDSSTPLGIIAKGASRNCLGIYRLSEETSKEEMAKIKEEQPGVYEMLKFYKEMDAELTAMLTHILVGKQAAVKAADKKPE